jgi:Rrf2 family protein
MMISESGIYGILACEFLATRTEKSHWPTKTISLDLDMSNEYLIKILQKLSQAGITESQKGKNGGVKLAVDPAEITLFEILRVTNPSYIDHCKEKLPLSANLKKVGLFSELQDLQKKTYSFLRNTTLQEFAESRQGNPDSK